MVQLVSEVVQAQCSALSGVWQRLAHSFHHLPAQGSAAVGWIVEKSANLQADLRSLHNLHRHSNCPHHRGLLVERARARPRAQQPMQPSPAVPPVDAAAPDHPQKEKLPEDLQAILSSQQPADASSRAKALHKQISVQAAFTKELCALRSQRLDYEKSWQQYVVSMASKFAEQLAEKRQIMTAFAEREEYLEEAARQAQAQMLSIACAWRKPSSTCCALGSNLSTL